jgi:tRNAThr (cytosine32-N3)-methyltransferase
MIKHGDNFLDVDELSLLFTGSQISKAEGNDHDASSKKDNDFINAVPEAGNALRSVPSDRDTPEPHEPLIHPNLFSLTKTAHPLFKVDQLGVDRRLLVNRKRQLRMYRVWVQGKFRKLPQLDGA